MRSSKLQKAGAVSGDTNYSVSGFTMLTEKELAGMSIDELKAYAANVSTVILKQTKSHKTNIHILF